MKNAILFMISLHLSSNHIYTKKIFFALTVFFRNHVELMENSSSSKFFIFDSFIKH